MKTIVIVSMLAVIFAIALGGEANAMNAKEKLPAVQAENAKNLIVGFSDKIPKDVHEKVKAHGASVVSKNDDINFVVVDPKGRNKAELMAELGKLPKAAYVEEDYIATAFLDPNDPGYPNQWGPKDINAPLAWNITLGSPGVIIAIVDTGVDYNHPDIAANYYIGGYDFINNDADPRDDNGHGTHVAGIAAAVTNNGVGVAGISQSRIMAEKVLSASGSGSYSAVANGITHAANNGAKVISLSLGGSSSSYTLQNAVNYAWNNKRAIVVAAAGNDNSARISYPAAYSNVIAVSALNYNDGLAWYSNFGKKIELAAPGGSADGIDSHDILSTYMGNNYKYLAGTSMATPFVTGTAALVLSKNSGLTNQQVRTILDTSAIDLGTPGRDSKYGYGRVDPYRALGITPLP